MKIIETATKYPPSIEAGVMNLFQSAIWNLSIDFVHNPCQGLPHSLIDKKRVKNNAIINIVQHSKGYLSVEVLFGMQIEKMVV